MKLSPITFYNLLINSNIEFFTGVPDSSLKELCSCIDDNTSNSNHVVAANEGNAIAIAAGYHLATGRLPFVYMQNSGFGNAANPLLSLCDPGIYSIPMIIMVGWRGEPGINDAVQHIKDGRIQLDLLKSMEIPYEILSKDDDKEEVEGKLRRCIGVASSKKRPVVIVVKTGTFAKHGNKSCDGVYDLLLREEALEIILGQLSNDSVVISTTGRTSSELFEIRERYGQPHFRDFLTVGSMGHCSSIALGIALKKPKNNIVCIDGDGALIMHMGSLAIIGMLKPTNFKHVLINNKVHESVGGQPTAAKYIDIPSLVRALGYHNIYSTKGKNELTAVLDSFLNSEGPSFLEIHVRPGTRQDLRRPSINLVENKYLFMDFLNGI